MILIKIPYGRGKQVLSINDARLQAVLQPCHDVPVNDRMISENEIVRQALENPIQSPRLCELTKVKHRVLVITSDHTRPVPSHITMPLLLQEIRKGNPDAEIILLIATGMHRPTTAAELRAKLGNTIVDAETIVVHDATNDQDMVTIGTLPSGGELRLNKLVLWADLIVSEGCIEPHFFAGFSGGRKSILPGIASQKTVLYNHNAQFLKNPMASQGHLDGNPIHRDMLYAAKAVELAFILNVLINADKRVIAAFAG
ncbi:MAG: nickel-dependent lactate racemase, partial [Clostridia bacterium]